MVFDADTVKERLRDRCGTAVESMYLQLYDDDDDKICDLNEFRPLGYYSRFDGLAESVSTLDASGTRPALVSVVNRQARGDWQSLWEQDYLFRIYIIGENLTSLSAGGRLEDTTLVEKYNISEDAYDKREDTYRKYGSRKVAEDREWYLAKEIANRKGETYVAPEAGGRCEPDPGGRRGDVKFVGKVDALAAGDWVGVHCDEPVAKHSASRALWRHGVKYKVTADLGCCGRNWSG